MNFANKLGQRVMVGAAIALASGLVGFAGPAHAASTGALPMAKKALYVGAFVGNNTGCASPGYTSVQAAVNAAVNGKTVYLCGTNPYNEDVVVNNKIITLTGDPGATLAPGTAPTASQLPTAFNTDQLTIPQANLIVWGSATTVTVTNLDLTGPFTSNSCTDEFYGVLAISGGAVKMTNDKVANTVSGTPGDYGCQQGVGIQIGREYWPGAGTGNNCNGGYCVENFVGIGTLTSVQVTGYQKNGMTIDGPGSSAKVTNSGVTGAGPTSPLGQIIAQNGIQVSRGALATLTGNNVAANQYSGTNNASATGILLFGGCGDPLVTGVKISGNTLTNNDIGIGMYNYNTACTAVTTTPTKDSALTNNVSNSADTNVSGNGYPQGYQAGIADVGDGDSIIGNTISGCGYAVMNTPSMYSLPIDTSADSNVTLKKNNTTGAHC
ncbi:MAG TPA: hypothetical protein VKX16_17895 [Chloroflexota bacterium]|nr:hypothetical protein [Chloroflexota bacterium]